MGKSEERVARKEKKICKEGGKGGRMVRPEVKGKAVTGPANWGEG